MTYSDVNDILAGDEERDEFKKWYFRYRAHIKLHERLESMRKKRGALNDTSDKILVE